MIEGGFKAGANMALRRIGCLVSAIIAVIWSVGPVAAQQVASVPSSPGATTTISGKQLPLADPKFGGVIKERAAESKAWWPSRVVPPQGAPNVLLIMTDDVGFAAL